MRPPRGPLVVAGLGAVALLVGCGSSPVPASTPRSRAVVAADATAPVVSVGDDGALVYAPDDQGNTIPDFSSCGYQGGGVALPSVPVQRTVDPPPSGDAGALIQAAIDEVSALPLGDDGFRGAVLLTRGVYRIAGTLHVRASGVVLRGEGASSTSGTALIATGATQRTLVEFAGSGAWKKVAGTEHALTADYVPVGARSFDVDSTDGLSVGDTVIVERPSTAEWIHDIGMDQIPDPNGTTVQWAPGSKNLLFDRVITDITGNTITVDAPLTNAFEQQYGGGTVWRYTFAGRIENVGIEYLKGDSEYKSATDEKHGWRMVTFEAVQNGWAKHLLAMHFGYSLVTVGRHAKWITVQDCHSKAMISQITGGRRYTFDIEGGQLNLFQRNHAEDGRHDFVTGSVVPGPNVFLDGVTDRSHADSGPHHRWAVGTLYDNIHVTGTGTGTGVGLNVRDRGASGTGHGWAGANQVFWNSSAPEIRCYSPPTATNWEIGCDTPKPSGDCHVEAFGAAVEPASLYRAQLFDRLGADAIKAIAH